MSETMQVGDIWVYDKGGNHHGVFLIMRTWHEFSNNNTYYDLHCLNTNQQYNNYTLGPKPITESDLWQKLV